MDKLLILRPASLFLLFTLLFSMNLYSQDTQVASLKVENIKIALIKEIDNMSDTTNHHHNHEPHKSSYRIIHINIDVLKNPLSGSVAKGNKTIIMVITDPDSIIVHEAEGGGGHFMLNGKESQYTMKHSLNYTGVSSSLDFLYHNPKKLKHGKYHIAFYSDGFKIGEDHFVVQ